MKLLVSTFDFHSFIFTPKVLILISKVNCCPNDCQADLIFIFHFSKELSWLVSRFNFHLFFSSKTWFALITSYNSQFNEVCLLSVILFSNFPFNWFANLVHSNSTAVANLNVHSLTSIASWGFRRCTIQSKKLENACMP